MLVDIGTALLPGLNYRTNYNDYKGILYQNPNGEQASLLGVQSQDSNAQLSAITGANNATASVQLCSNGGLFGGSTNLRGWTLQKRPRMPYLRANFTIVIFQENLPLMRIPVFSLMGLTISYNSQQLLPRISLQIRLQCFNGPVTLTYIVHLRVCCRQIITLRFRATFCK